MSHTLTINKTWDGKPPTSPSYEVKFSLSAQNGDMQIVIDAPYHNDPPPPFPAGKIEGLHMYEVVEIFISGFPYNSDPSETPYLEIQIGPHGHYFLAFFMREADWDGQDTSLDFVSAPIVDIMHTTRRWHATLSVPSYYLPEPNCGENYSVEWRANVCAIHNVDGEKEYLSCARLTGNEVDFHQLGSFIPIRLFETLEVRNVVDRTKSIAHDKLSLTPPKKNAPQTVFQLTEELRRAVLEESVLAVEERHSASYGKRTTTSEGEEVKGEEDVMSVEDICRQIRDQLLQSDALTDLEENFQRHLAPDEFVILHSFVWKRRGISFKKRKLILTSKPRLLYLTQTGEFKGQITWSMTKRLKLTARNAQKFDIVLSDNTRTYHFSDGVLGSKVWLDALEAIMQGQKKYLTKSRKGMAV